MQQKMEGVPGIVRVNQRGLATSDNRHGDCKKIPHVHVVLPGDSQAAEEQWI